MREAPMVEVEAKFTLADEVWHRLQAAESLGGYSLAAGRIQEVRDVYLDTAGRRVLAAGYCCRQREEAGKEGVQITLKALRPPEGAIHRREEMELWLPAVRPLVEWPESEVRQRLWEWIGSEPLRPLFTLEQTRTIRPVHHGERLVAELSLDEVRLAGGKGRRTEYEVEVERAGQGTEEDLAAIGTVLTQEWGGRPQPASKFERGLELAAAAGRVLLPAERAACERLAGRDDRYGRRARALLALDAGATQAVAGRRAGLSERRVRYWLAAFRRRQMGIFPPRLLSPETEEPASEGVPGGESRPTVVASGLPVPEPSPLPPGPGLLADAAMAAAARKTLSFHFRRMLLHEAGAHQGQDIEEVHDMRVAVRRMRAALRLFADFLAPKPSSALARELRRAGRLLGAVRDLDVFYEKAQRYRAGLPAERQPDLDPLLAVWAEQHRRSRQSLLTYLDGRRYARLKERLEKFLERPASEEESSPPRRLRHLVPGVLYQALAVVRAYEEWLVGPDVPLARYHQLRIAGKGLRYALEFFRDVLGPESADLIERMKALQDHLGDLQDAVVACDLLRDFLTWGTWGHDASMEERRPAAPVVAPGVAAYLAFRQTEIQHLVATLDPVWERVRGSEFGRLLAEALRPLI